MLTILSLVYNIRCQRIYELNSKQLVRNVNSNVNNNQMWLMFNARTD